MDMLSTANSLAAWTQMALAIANDDFSLVHDPSVRRATTEPLLLHERQSGAANDPWRVIIVKSLAAEFQIAVNHELGVPRNTDSRKVELSDSRLGQDSNGDTQAVVDSVIQSDRQLLPLSLRKGDAIFVQVVAGKSGGLHL